jgi:hypothetical protein
MIPNFKEEIKTFFQESKKFLLTGSASVVIIDVWYEEGKK